MRRAGRELRGQLRTAGPGQVPGRAWAARRGREAVDGTCIRSGPAGICAPDCRVQVDAGGTAPSPWRRGGGQGGCAGRRRAGGGGLRRSEEHTSELQSLMRISYAVFCLKKKKNNKTKNNHIR